MSAPKILVVAGDATEDLEPLYGLQRLTDEGYQVTIAAPKVERLNLGGTFVDAAPVVDGNLVSVRDWSENPQLFREFLRLLRRHAPLTA
ncbi:hypothetical protein ACTVZO_01000 [Streptomyces sp. IBSNAI002]|uniref:hypothetical protein n=1 Tax=Streptomyces sp. IBSNAI002 TaxID=3457500 RepID=UPI003FD1AC6F